MRRPQPKKQPHPKNLQSLLTQARSSFGAGDSGGALKRLNQALAAAPRNPEVLNDRGAVLGSMGRLEEALACFEQVLATAPDHVDALNNHGLLLGMLGCHAEALLSLDRALVRAPGRFDVLCNRGYSLNELGLHAEALSCLDAALAINRGHFGAWSNRGLALNALARHAEAEISFANALAIKPGDFGALLNRAVALNELDRCAEALACIEQALAISPDQPEALNTRGAILLKLDRAEEALACFDRVLTLAPDHSGVLGNRAVALGRLERFDEALACFDKASSLQPGDFSVSLNRAIALGKLYRYAEALQCVDQALAIQPDHVEALNNRGSTLLRINRLEEALACLDRAVAIDPDHIEALNTRGAILWGMNRAEEARGCFTRILDIRPGHINATNNLSFIDLAFGDLPKGFRGQEIRWQTEMLRRNKPRMSSALWLGQESLEGKTILLCHEQGFGDTLQFVRYLPLVAERAGRVVLAVPPALRSILQSLPARFDIVTEGELLPPHDYHCPIMSLPLAFGTTLDSVPANVPYLAAEPARIADWAARLGQPRKPRIGLVWAGRQTPPVNYPRDMSLQLLQPLLELDAEFISLQKDIPAGDRALLEALPRIARHGESLGDFSDTAALIANLDLVITVDTSVSHLAAAMGKPVWLMNRHASCWRWLRDRDDSPWYPGLRQFRQHSLGDWDGVVRRVREAAEQFLQEHAARSRPTLTPAPTAADAESFMRQGLTAVAGADYETAITSFTQVLARQPQHLLALYNLGATLGTVGFHEEALTCFDRALALQPGNVDVLCNRGLVLGRLERFEEAQTCFEQVLAFAPQRADALNGLGLALANQDRHEASLACFEQSLALAPNDLGVVLSRGLALGKLHRFEEALVCFWRVLAQHPDSVEALLNRGIMLDKLKRRDEALACYERVLALDPEQAEARCDRGLNRLARGQFREGFEDFESRWDAFLSNARPDTVAPQWRGDAPLQGKTILLYHEQGYGDTLQFVRYAALIAQRGGRVLLLVPRGLHSLLQSLPCEVEMVAEGEPLPPHDYQCPMMSLPLAFGTTLETIPAEVPYVGAEPWRVAAWGSRLGAKIRPRIGLAWAGRQYPPINYTRDMPLEVLVPLLALEADFISLQKDVPERDRPLLNRLDGLARHGEAAVDFADSAALIANLDLVITVDTATAHLAGAMGKPVWIMSRYASCWRWLEDREDSPWYPSVRLFRQRAMRDWVGVLEQLGPALVEFIQAHAAQARSGDEDHLGRGLMLGRSGQHEEAVAAFDRALALDPQTPEALLHRGMGLARLERIEEAFACFNRVLAAQPGSVDALFNRGLMLDKMNRREEALACYDAVLAAQPQHTDARCNRGLVLMGFGRFAEGFADYESRWDTETLRDTRLKTRAPLWLGQESLHGKTILLHHEQGYGDAIQFARYVPLLAQRAGRVIMGTLPELRELMRSLPGPVEFISDGEPMPPHDFYCPMMSLPLAFGTTIETIPANVPYLAADAARTAEWRGRLEDGESPRIGLAWSGRRLPPLNIPRDMDLELLLPLLELDADFVSLQKEIPSGDRFLLQHLPRLRRYGETLRDFADTAALLANLDLVITVDSAVAHLAGAMGKPVWLMNRYAPCWRWLRERNDSPWYPSLRQFRQGAPGDWAGVVGDVRKAMLPLLSRHAVTA